jgi:hypothetical protein
MTTQSTVGRSAPGTAFLPDLQARALTTSVAGLDPLALHIGMGDLALEVTVFSASTKPAGGVLQAAWKARRGSRSVPVLVVALFAGRAWLCGPAGETPPIHADVDPGVAERLCRAALAQPDRHAALRFLDQALPSLDTKAPGLRNEGLFALHELIDGAPKRPDWAAMTAKARAAVGLEGTPLLRQLGFTVEPLDNMTQLLKGGDRRLALAVLIDRTDSPEAGTPKFNNLSPISYALDKADKENLDWVLALQGDRIRLYPVKMGEGVGRRGRTETYVELQTALLGEEHQALLPLLFSADALKDGGSVKLLLDNSRRFAVDLAERLRERIYLSVVPSLARGMAAARNTTAPDAAELDLTYRMALTVLFRLLFVAYAEDRDLLPYRHSEPYRRASLKQMAQELAEGARGLIPPGAGDRYWTQVRVLWDAIERSDTGFSVPAYNGGLFTRDPAKSVAGAALATISLPDAVFQPALRDLLLSDAEGVLQPVDFRSLGVREFGTIYEGLLESELSVADQDLSVDRKGSYVPAGRNPVVVARGEIYLHNRSGARKASGSYFTKSFAVEHLLDRALVPALDEHLARVAALDEADAAAAFFDFRVADIAMGSGHFLVAAVDRIEKGFTAYLAKPEARGVAGVRDELSKLKAAARATLGDLADEMAFEDGQLLRRMIARRCIYGVDLNPLSVELARLAIWIHTFVPGLPLSVLDHNLVHGNALVGVGTVDEIRERFEAAGTMLFPVDAHSLLSAAERPLKRLANLSDATIVDVDRAREAMEEARISIGDTRALCDIITAAGLDPQVKYQFENWERDRTSIQSSAAGHRAHAALAGLNAFHFPIAFPEVFLRRRSGFDVLLGNPPWQEATVEDDAFWARHFPGLRGLPPAEMEAERARLRAARPDLVAVLATEVTAMARVRKALTSGAFPGMGTGDPDLYKAFGWRFWNLATADGGRIGVVLPRNAFAAKGSELLRKEMFAKSASVDLTMLLNNRQWVFDEVHPQYTFGLAAIKRGPAVGQSILLRGPFADEASFNVGRLGNAAQFNATDVLSWNDTASLPLLPTEKSLSVFTQLRKAPRLDLDDRSSWRARPDAEFHATAQRPLMTFTAERPEGYWPVFKGESFDQWSPDRGSQYYYAWAEPIAAKEWLYARRLRAARGGANADLPLPYRQQRGTLACLAPRVAFRDVTNRTNQRTIIASLLPGEVFITNKGPYLVWPRGDERDQAYLLGVLNSRSLDWYARRFVELNVNFFIFNPLPIPRPLRTSSLWQRVVALAGRLAAPDERFANWAAAVSVDHGPLAPDVKQDMIDELDAVVARLYGLNAAQLTHLFETFHEGWDYAPRLAAVLAHFNRTPADPA